MVQTQKVSKLDRTDKRFQKYLWPFLVESFRGTDKTMSRNISLKFDTFIWQIKYLDIWKQYMKRLLRFSGYYFIVAKEL
jgi:hypothetical protein